MNKLNDFINYLGLKKPVELTIKTVRGEDEDAYYVPIRSDRGRLIGHEIVIFTVDTQRLFDTLLAHELIHAWQEEKKLTETHGPKFKDMAMNMEETFDLIEVYIPEVDIE